MFIEKITLLAKRKKCKHGNRIKNELQLKRTQSLYRYQCDLCNQIFTVKKVKKSVYQFCSKKCKFESQQKGNKLCNLIENTCNKNYGKPRAFAQLSVIEKAKITSHTDTANQKRSLSLRKWHVNRCPNWKNPGNTLQAQKKRHETMKRNHTYSKSKVENKLYDILCAHYGLHNIERQFIVKTWPIDFYIKSEDIYIQLDGVYWHGLDRPIEVISQHSTKRDIAIHKKWILDREQDTWFEKNNMKLIRITDKQFLSGQRPW